MKKNIHPVTYKINFICSCKNLISVYSTLKKDFQIDVCYKCHSFYTGKQKISNVKGRLDKFKQRLNNINYLFFTKKK